MLYCIAALLASKAALQYNMSRLMTISRPERQHRAHAGQQALDVVLHGCRNMQQADAAVRSRASAVQHAGLVACKRCHVDVPDSMQISMEVHPYAKAALLPDMPSPHASNVAMLHDMAGM